MITVQPVSNKKGLKEFVDFPHDLYKNDENYVPELFIAQRDLLTPSHHPFHQHSQIQLFLAYDNNKIVGRIAAILNNNHNQFNKTKDGFFGFFDCIDNAEVSDALLQTAEKWVKEKGMNRMMGPVNFSTNETCGLLIQGYDSPPVAMMTYNYPYYSKLIEKDGYKKETDLIAYQIVAGQYNDKSVKLMDAFTERLKRKGITIRKVSLKNFKEEVKNLREVYNSAWDKNLGFVPMTENEFNYLAKDLKLILDTDFCLLAEHEGKIVGFALCIPDVNQILRKIKRGRLFPFGIFKLLTQKKKINAIRVIALGVVEGYRKLGIEAIFYGTIMNKCAEKNIGWAEASWILEDNVMMNQALENINAKPYKKYRIYEKSI